MATPSPRPPRPHSTWSQPSLIPPEVIRVDFTWFVDVHMNRMQLGWTISEGVEEQTVSMEVLPWRKAHDGIDPFVRSFRNVLMDQIGRAVPFP